MRYVTILIVLVLGSLLSPLVAEMEFEECRGFWNVMEHADYEFFITQIRSSEEDAQTVFDGTFRVTVRDDAVVEVVPVHVSEQPLGFTPEFPGTIDDIYRIVAEARENKRVSVEFQCHAAWHYPAFVHIREKGSMPRDAVAWSVLLVLEPEPIGAMVAD